VGIGIVMRVQDATADVDAVSALVPCACADGIVVARPIPAMIVATRLVRMGFIFLT